MATSAMRSKVSGAAQTLKSNPSFQAGQNLGDNLIDRGKDRVYESLSGDLAPDTEFQVVDEEGHVVKTTTADEFETEGLATASIMDVVRLIGGSMIGIAVLVVVLNEIFQLDSIANASGPFSGITDSLTGVGASAISLLVVGLLVVAANRIMGFFGGGGM